MIIIDPGTQSVVEKGNMNFSISARESEWRRKSTSLSFTCLFVQTNGYVAWSTIITPCGNPYLKPIYQPVQWIWSFQVWTQMCLELSCRERRGGFCHGIHVGKLHVWCVKLSLTKLMIPEKFTFCFFQTDWSEKRLMVFRGCQQKIGPLVADWSVRW